MFAMIIFVVGEPTFGLDFTVEFFFDIDLQFTYNVGV
jgi:hypothetical protein